VRRFGYKNDIIVNLSVLEASVFLAPVFTYLYFINQGANFVKICNIYANQLVIKVAISLINSDKLRRSYDDCYLGVTFWDTRCFLYEFKYGFCRTSVC